VTDYGLCIPGCELCEGLGFIRNDSGELVGCKNNPRRYNGSGVTADDVALYRILPKSQAIARAMAAFDKLIKDRYGLMYFSGNPGTGKTVCSRAYTAAAIDAGFKALYIRQSEMVNYLRSSYDADKGQLEYQARLDKFKAVEWLVIDEIGRDRMTDFAQESMAEIVDSRYTSAIKQQKVTVLVSNFMPEQVFQDYLVDRIRDSRNTILDIQSKSLRGKK
jgi:DNA replication protein DnaC